MGSLRDAIAKMAEGAGIRLDGWENAITGMGISGVDKNRETINQSIRRLSDVQLTSMFHTDHISKAAVSLLPEDALSKGFTAKVDDEKGGTDTATKLMKEADRLRLGPVMREALTWERLYGGAVIWKGVDDGQRAVNSQEKPMRVESLRKVLWLKVIDRRFLRPVPGSIIDDHLSPDFGEAAVYEVVGRLPTRHGLRGMLTRRPVTRIHRSRLTFLWGPLTTSDIRETTDGWGLSTLQAAYESIQRNASAWQAAGTSMNETAYTKMSIDGLMQMIADGQEEVIKKRVAMLNYGRSHAKTAIFDTLEKYERDQLNFQGVPQMLRTMQTDVAAAVRMPVTKMFGTSAVGMSATGEGEEDDWTMSVDGYRENDIHDPAKAILDLAAKASEGPIAEDIEEDWTLGFPEFQPLNDKERSEVFKNYADGAGTLVDKEVLRPEEVALSLFRPEGFTPEFTIDRDSRDAILALDMKREVEEAKDPPPPPPQLVPGAVPDPDAEETSHNTGHEEEDED